MERIKIPTPISGGLLLSYRCTASCRHCMYACSPRWNADWIGEDQLEKGLNLLAGKIQPSPFGRNAIGINYGLHFTGGEPFLNFDLLLKAVKMAKRLEIPSTFVETNCFWCKDEETTREKLSLLKKAGLHGILISVNPFYAEYVPFERTEQCIRSSLDLFGRNVIVYQVEYLKRFKHLGIKDRMPLEAYMELVGKESLTREVELFLSGRAGRKLKDFYPALPAQSFFNGSCAPAFLRSWHNHFDNYGNLMPGYCGGISLGSWFDLDRLLEEGINPKEQPVLALLVHEDLEGLYHFAGEHGFEEDEEGYLSRCDLCLKLREFLVSKARFKELEPKEFYTHLG